MLQGRSSSIARKKSTSSSPSSQPSASSSADPTLFYTEQQTVLLRQLTESKKTDLEDLANFLNEFCLQFPGGDKDIIHVKDKKEYSLFSSTVYEALISKYNASSDRYTLYRHTHNKNNQCVEANILQAIAKLGLPMNLQTNERHRLVASYADIIQEMISRSTKYFSNPASSKQINHLTFTLASLTNMDINHFRVQTKAKSFFDSDQDYNLPLEGIVGAALHQIEKNLNTWSATALIRAIHSIIILSNSKAGFRNYLSADLAKLILEEINNKLHPLSDSNPTDVHLAQQLFQIRNIYPDVFPDNISAMIDPFISIFNQSTHGSAFENAIFRTLKQSARELFSQYPLLIDERLFNNSNPICEALGLESDLTYENGLVKTCIQVDGDKYHTYPGSKRATQKTLLRDHCFLQDGWELIKFTDKQNNIETAKQFLMDAIVIPTFEAKTKLFLSQHQHFQENSILVAHALVEIEKHDKKIKKFYQELCALEHRIPSYDSKYYQMFEELKEHYNYLSSNTRLASDAKSAIDAIQAQDYNAEVLKAKAHANISQRLTEVNASIKLSALNLKRLQERKSKLSSDIMECSEKLNTTQQDLAKLDALKLPLQAQLSEIYQKKQELKLANEALAAFRQSLDRNKVKPKLGRQEIEEQAAALNDEEVTVERELNTIDRNKVKLKHALHTHQDALALMEEKQKAIQIDIEKEDEDLHHLNVQSQEFEAALQAPAAGENMMAHFNKITEFIAYSDDLNEGLASLDSQLNQLKELKDQIDEEELSSQFEGQSLDMQPSYDSLPMPNSGADMYYYTPSPDEIAYQEYLAYMAYQQQLAYDFHMQQYNYPYQPQPWHNSSAQIEDRQDQIGRVYVPSFERKRQNVATAVVELEPSKSDMAVKRKTPVNS